MAASSDRSLRQIATSNDKLEAVNGKVKGVNVIHKFGAREAVTTALTPLTKAGLYPTPTTATALELVSTDNTNDIALGAGALTVEIHGIQDWDVGEAVSTITLTGTTPVAAGSWLRVYRMKVSASGVYAEPGTPSHNSTITLRVAAAGATWAAIGVASTNFGASQSEIACYSIPANEHAHIIDVTANVDTAQSSNIFLYVREDADAVAAPFGPLQLKQAYRNIKGDLKEVFDYPLGPFYGPCDILMLVQTTAATADIEGRFTVVKERDH